MPLMVLALGSVFVGYLGRDMFIGAGTDFWRHSLCVLPQHDVLVESEYLPLVWKWLPLGSVLVGALMALGVQSRGWPVPGAWYRFVSGRWYVDTLYRAMLGWPVLRAGYTWTWKAVDKGSLEVLGPWGIATTAVQVAEGVRRMQSGRMYHYAVVMLLGMVFFMTWTTLAQAWDARVSAMLVLSGMLMHFEKTAG
jgi:NADH:ubiquinone oxidoreductase subunit 5 (subunit L)/multisubunit Na+/H+ antiporter MnhA subunit